MAVTIVNTPTNDDSLPTILYKNLMATGTVSASSSDTDYPVANISTEATTEYWKPTATPSWVKLSLSSATDVDAVAIVGHTLGTTGSTLTFQGSADNSTWVDIAQASPTDDSCILLCFPTKSYQYYRVYISGSTTYPIISTIFIGERFRFPAGVMPPYTPVWACQTYELLTATTVGGQFIGNRILATGGQTSINLVAVETDFALNTLEDFRKHYNEGKAFIWAMSPSEYATDVGYVWRTEKSIMNPTFSETGSWMSVSMEVYVYGD